MTTFHSMASTTTRKIVWTAVILLAATAAACGGSTQGLAGTAPSQVSSVAASDNGGTFSLLKEGKGKGRPTPDIGTTPTTGTTPDPDDPEEDGDELGKGHGHGKATIQIEGLTEKIDGTCPNLIIKINGLTVNTVDTPDLTTDFQRATCEALKASTALSIHVHIAAKKMVDESLVATYVRMQGPKFDDGDDASEEEETEAATN
jgi:hypothetical protein